MSNTKPTGNGVVFVATGQKYIDEAAESASSVKAHMPDVPIALVTDSATGPDVFDQVVEFRMSDSVPKAYSGYLYKIQGLEKSPFERSVFLDTDIHCSAAFAELFTLLAAYDLGACLACLAGDNSQVPTKTGLPHDHPPMYAPQMNSGVIVYKLNEPVVKFIKSWSKIMMDGSPKDGRYYSDQTIWEGVLAASQVRFATLPAEYNCRIGVPQKLHGTVKLLHGRPQNGWQAHVDMINMNHGYRIYFPNMGVVTMDQGFFNLNGASATSTSNITFRDFTRNLFTPGVQPVATNDKYAVMKNEGT